MMLKCMTRDDDADGITVTEHRSPRPGDTTVKAASDS
eukprot:CAMPEP_0206022600 /NCGR_PEP_ID=MMETSP1464-20131121/34990_1 /ASSEMBLY_ACC=CAM_ASM_001124 /TAXON_ID=119497 /ORGANISM="Exanthemachrysis gayraliae, Strain RCC1523" /LENGTH=36 /DNA_ID= /DNA_START= /DNA_END= /DNA_ORIENTATION=